MSTKGASNHYGNAKHGSPGIATKHIGFAWAKDFNKATLSQHFLDHGSQMGCQSKESYAAHAVSFANYIDRNNVVSFVDKNGTTYKYNKLTNTFAIITKTGYVVTFFKPSDGYQYYLKQKKERNKHGKR